MEAVGKTWGVVGSGCIWRIVADGDFESVGVGIECEGGSVGRAGGGIGSVGGVVGSGPTTVSTSELVSSDSASRRLALQKR